MSKFDFSKINGKSVLGVVISVASVITAVNNFVSDRKQANEFEEMKKAVEELQKKN